MPELDINLYKLMAEFRKEHLPKWNGQTADDYIGEISAACRAQGLYFHLRESAVPLGSDDHVAAISFEATVYTPVETLSMGHFTVSGNLLTVRSTVYTMAIIEFAGVYRELEKAYRNYKDLPVVGATVATMSVDTPEPPIDEPRDEKEDEVEYIQSTTSDGVPILVNPYDLEGTPETVAIYLAGVLERAIASVLNSPMLEVLWTNNSEPFSFIKDYAPPAFDRLKQLTQARDEALSAEAKAEPEPTPAAEPKSEPTLRRRTRRRKAA